MGVPRERDNVFTVENVAQYELNKVVTEFDNKFFFSLMNKNFGECEQYLTDFCFELLDLTDAKQVFVARIFYVSIITDIIRIQNQKERLHPKVLATSYGIIGEIESWENISEYILHSRWLVEQIKYKIIGDHLLIDACKHVEGAIQLIDDHLEEDFLTVKWLANKLEITSAHLSNLFKLHLGETVGQYIAKRKMSEIVFELTYTNKTLKEVRERFGFYNHSHFIQHFKRHKGVTPLKFRQRIHHIKS